MRVNPDSTPDILSAIWKTQSQAQTALEQLSTGKRVNRPSDDPAAAATVVQNQAEQDRIDQYVQSVNSLNSQFQTADSTLSTMVTSLNRAVSLGVEAGNSSLSPQNQQSIAQEAQGVLDQLVQLANTSFNGSYIFGGTNTTQQPFTVTASGVTYNGNSGVNQVAIADGRTLQSNLPGNQLFQSSGSDVLGSVQQLVTALQSGNTAAIQTATSSISSALNYLNGQRVFYGNGMDQLSDDTTMLNSTKLNLQAQQTALVGADPTQAATDLSKAETANQAALAAAARVLSKSLLDYLPIT
jgi:flagellar hook-associated protein 3 FlgL